MASTISEVAVAFVGALVLDRTYYLISVLLFLDHVGEMEWYLWLAQNATQSREKLRMILARVSSISLLLLGTAIFSAFSNMVVIALEVSSYFWIRFEGIADTLNIQHIICAMSSTYSQVHRVVNKGTGIFVGWKSHDIAFHLRIKISQPLCQGTGRRGKGFSLNEPPRPILNWLSRATHLP